MESDPLQELKRLMGEATPEPWVNAHSFQGIYSANPSPGPVQICRAPDPHMGGWEVNGSLIVAMRGNIAELIRKVEAYDKIMALPVVHVDMVCAVDAVVIDEIPNPNELRGQRVRIVPVADGEQIPMRNWPKWGGT